MSILLSLLLLLPVVYVLLAFKNRRKYELAAKWPGPKTVPLLGNIPMYLNKGPEDIIQLMESNFAKFGTFYRVWIGPFTVAFFMSDPKDAEVVLTSNRVLKKNNLYDHLIPWLGTGLLISEGKKWHSRRKIITPTFHFKILEQFLETFNRKGSKMIEKIAEEVPSNGTGVVVDVHKFVNACTLEIICETAMGIEFNSMDKANEKYIKAVARISEIASSRFVKVWMRPEIIFRLFCPALKKDFDRCIKTMHSFTNGVIETRREMLIRTTDEVVEEEDFETLDEGLGIKRRMALLDVLLQSKIDDKPLTNSDIREEVETFMFEGHDTTTSGISFTLHAISKHPEVQQKVYEELREVLSGRDSSDLTYSDLGELKYLELVIKESLRMNPPVPMFGRFCEEEFEINGKTIPKGCNIAVSPYLIGKNPDLYPEPDKFIPERFTKENMAERNAFAFIAFSAGPRNCIGQKFAMNELKSLISKILYHFELYDSGIELVKSFELVYRSKNGFHVGMRRRNGVQ